MNIQTFSEKELHNMS